MIRRTSGQYQIHGESGWRDIDRPVLYGLYGLSILYDGRDIPAFHTRGVPHRHISKFRDDYEAMFGNSRPEFEVRPRDGASPMLTINGELLCGNMDTGWVEAGLLRDGCLEFGLYCTITPEYAHGVFAAVYQTAKI